MGQIKASKEPSTPEIPSAGFMKLYFLPNGCLYSLDEYGVETKFEQGAETVITASIGPSGSVDLDTIPLTGLCTVKYIVCVGSNAEDKWRSFEMLAGKKTSNSLEDTVYSKIGSIIDVDFNFNAIGANAKLIGTNNEAFSVDIKIQKVLL